MCSLLELKRAMATLRQMCQEVTALVFELHYPDGRVEYELPSVSSAAAGLRIAGLLDNIGRTRYDALREILVKTLAQSVWREHPEVESVRAILGSIRLPTVREFEEGKRESYEFLYAYDFSLENEPAKRTIAKQMQRVKNRLLEFLFPVETDNWLAVLRVGLGLQVTLYSLSLAKRLDLSAFGNCRKVWRKHCFLWKAILSRDSGGSLLSRHDLACVKRQYSFCRVDLFACCWLRPSCRDSPAASRRLPRGFYIYAQRKAEGSCPMAWIIS